MSHAQHSLHHLFEHGHAADGGGSSEPYDPPSESIFRVSVSGAMQRTKRPFPRVKCPTPATPRLRSASVSRRRTPRTGKSHALGSCYPACSCHPIHTTRAESAALRLIFPDSVDLGPMDENPCDAPCPYQDRRITLMGENWRQQSLNTVLPHSC